MKILIIFVLIISLHYANNIQLKSPFDGCSYLLKMYSDDPSIKGPFEIMKLIPLSQKSKTIAGKYFAMVDDEDYEYLSQFTWHLRKVSNLAHSTFYAGAKNINAAGRRTNILMHRMILGLKDPAILIDHKDRDGLNNQKINLRIATSLENARNKGKTPGKTSQYLGVNINSHTPRHTRKDGTVKVYPTYTRWIATIRIDGKLKYLGRHKEEEAAARAYDVAAKHYFGEFANLNFKDE